MIRPRRGWLGALLLAGVPLLAVVLLLPLLIAALSIMYLLAIPPIGYGI